MTNQVTNLAGFTLRVGQRVFFRFSGGSEGWATIREFERTKRATFVKLDPEPDAVRGADCWTLNAEHAARNGHADYWEPRDRGVTMGNIWQACTKRPVSA